MGITIKEMKEWLKTSATEIRIRKAMHKDYQRKGCEKYEWVDEACYGSYRMATHPEARKFWDNMSSLWELRREYRHRHIAYSELRGKTRDQIEASYPYEGQSEWDKPDEKRIKAIKEEIIETMESQRELRLKSASSQVV